MSKYLTYNGETHNYSEWARLLGINKITLTHRLRHGWSVEKALSKKLYKPGKMGRKVKCVETGVIYNSVNECANVFYIEPANIRNCASGRTKSCCGHHFEYVDD